MEIRQPPAVGRRRLDFDLGDGIAALVDDPPLEYGAVAQLEVEGERIARR